MSKRQSNAPQEFRDFASLFDLDLLDEKFDENMILDFALKHTRRSARSAIAGYLNELLRGNFDDDHLQRIWFDSGASLFFSNPGELRRMLERMRDSLS